MTVRDHAIRHLKEYSMSDREAALCIEEFARTKNGKDFGWGNVAPGLSRAQKALIDQAGQGSRMRHGAPEPEPVPDARKVRDGRMLAAEGASPDA